VIVQFADLRQKVYKMSDAEYLQCIGDAADVDNITNHFSEGASGSFFCMSFCWVLRRRCVFLCAVGFPGRNLACSR
jgi:hypothetical protein